jgi:glycosyltransferase involved in cell wall biosynthesis
MIKPFKTIGCKSMTNKPEADADIAIFFRVKGKKIEKQLMQMKDRGIKTVFDVNVNYYEQKGNLQRMRGLVSDEQVRDCISMTKKADAVVTASRFIQRRAERHNSHVHYIPDSVNQDHFSFRKSPDSFSKERLNLVWSGHSEKAAYIDSVAENLSDLPVTFTVISNKPPKLKTPHRFVQWHYKRFPRDIVKGDICISPRILDNSYDKGHSNFKILVFLAQGIPVLASPQESYAEVVQNHYNGFICQNFGDWKRWVKYLIENRHVLDEMSQNAVASASPYLTMNIVSSYSKLFTDLVPGFQGHINERSFFHRLVSNYIFHFKG